MKTILTVFFSLFSFFSEAQMSGYVIDNEFKPVPYATVFNIKTNTGCQADSIGFFSIQTSINDSIRIQHLGFKTGNFIVTQNSVKYTLIQKVYDFKEITVSNTFPLWLYFKSYKKTIAKLKDKSRDRFYCNAIKIVNSDTLQKYILDLDFEQKKATNSSDVEIRSRFFKVKRYAQNIKSDFDPYAKYNIIINIFPKLDLPRLKEAPNINVATINDDYNFIMTTDSQYIKISFIPKKKAPAYYKTWEATILKSDTCLASFAVSNVALNWKSQENKPDQIDQSIYYNISYSNGFGYISEIYSSVNFKYVTNNKKYINSYILNLHNYAHGIKKLKRRFGISCLDNNIAYNEKQKSRGSGEYWKNDDFQGKAPYDFERLQKLKQQIYTQ